MKSITVIIMGTVVNLISALIHIHKYDKKFLMFQNPILFTVD
jgi:hypothetical protein